jgi:hypothetical protein
MKVAHSERPGAAVRLLLGALIAVVILGMLGTLPACGSSGSRSEDVGAAPVKTAITEVLPRDAAAEPPWNGRFVQVNVRTQKPGAMDPGDWRVFVNGKEPELDKAPSVLPYAPHGAVVAFVFRTPYGDAGTFEFRVVYAPKGAKEAERSWDYER